MENKLFTLRDLANRFKRFGLSVAWLKAEAEAGRIPRWADPDFRRRVAELRADMVSRATGKMGDGMAEAADVLRALLKAESESVRLGAPVYQRPEYGFVSENVPR